MKHLFLFFFVWSSLFLQAQDPYVLQPQIDVLHYTHNIILSDKHDSIIGKSTIQFKLNEKSESLWFDLHSSMKVNAFELEGKKLVFKQEKEKLSFSTSSLKPGNVFAITISYSGIPTDGLIISKNKHGDRTFFGDNWPNRAHHWFPCIDHPSDKATFRFEVTAPSHYQVVSNGVRKEFSILEDQKAHTVYETPHPIPTKVALIGVAEFAIEYLTSTNGNNVQTWVYRQDRDYGFYDFALAAQIVDFFEDRLGKFPYEKLANVQSKTRYGGMENAGCIFYHEDAVTGDRSSEELLAHEIAHQWFGNTASEKSWEHIWLSEGFATYLTGLYLKETYNQERFLAYMKKAEERVLAFANANPKATVIPEEINNLNDLLNPFSYQKGAWVLFMLANHFAIENEWEYLSSYFKSFKYDNATTNDFLNFVPTTDSISIDEFKSQWLTGSTIPMVLYTYSFNEVKNEVTIKVKQDQKGNKEMKFPMEFGFQFEGAISLDIKRVWISEKKQEFIFKVPTNPNYIIADPLNKLLGDNNILD